MNQILPMSLHFLAGAFGALGQYFYKKGGLREGPIWENWQLGVGILSFCVVMVLFVVSYKLGGRISSVYPAYAATFIWGAILGHYLDGEPLNATVLLGIGLILIGVAVVGMGAIRQ
jgi:drug/metabolite transporter (DMT)-like permease